MILRGRFIYFVQNIGELFFQQEELDSARLDENTIYDHWSIPRSTLQSGNSSVVKIVFLPQFRLYPF